ncbi:hypothetical protein [Novosphingobium sp.]|uniref:hypothetical protein n=1 Tax=Novosphingobium sp. TaxID=1874826 RepID=UPI0038B96FB5
MRKLACAGLAVMLASCSGSEKPPEVPRLALQPILYADVTGSKLYGSGCNFVASDGGMGAVFLAQAERGIIKLADKVISLPVDPASPGLPQAARERYAGSGYKASLTRVPGGKSIVNGVVEIFAAHFVLTDGNGVAVYDTKGDAQCKPM